MLLLSKLGKLNKVLGRLKYTTFYEPHPITPISENTFGKVLYDSLVKHRNLPVALKDAVTEETVSYNTLLDKSCGLAVSLKELGCTPNSTIGILSENNVHYFYAILAALYSGVSAVPFSSNSTPRELIHLNNISKPKVVFCSKSMLKILLEARPHLQNIEKIVLIDTDEHVENLETIDSIITKPTDFQPMKFNPRLYAGLVLFSSGTTGLPKGVTTTHHSLNAIYGIFRDPRIFRRWQLGDHASGHLPLHHGYGLMWALYSILTGTPLVVTGKFEPNMFLKSIQDYKFGTLCLVPSQVEILATHPLVDAYDLSSVLDIVSTTAPLRKGIEDEVRRRLNVKYIRQAFVTTEGFVLAINRFEECKPESCGKVVPFVKGKVVDIHTREVLGPNQTGELLFKGDPVTKSYYGDKDAISGTIDKEGWICTGDVGYYDNDGFLYVVDTLKGLIKYKGIQVSSAELEAVLAAHPKIKEACVVGIPNDKAGELPLAVVVKESGQDLTEEEVIKFVADQVAPENQLRGGVRFVDELPKNALGKILGRKVGALISKI